MNDSTLSGMSIANKTSDNMSRWAAYDKAWAAYRALRPAAKEKT